MGDTERLEGRDLPDLLRKAGVTRKDAETPESVTLPWLRRQCEQLERVLRLQYREDDGDLDARDEEELRHRPILEPDVAEEHPHVAMTLAMRRWAYLKHLYISRHQSLQRVEQDDRRRQLMMELVRREPVVLQLPGREIEVTDRSYAALYEIARHAARLSDLEQDLSRIRALRQRVRELAGERHRAGEGWNHLRRRHQYLNDLYRATLREMRNHRRMMYAHVTTEDGSPARSLEDAPAWWDEVGPLDDVRLMEAVREAGAKRVQALGPMPERPDRDQVEVSRLEDWGWVTPFRDWDQEQPLPDPQESWMDRPLGQKLAAERAAADPVVEHRE